MTSDDLYQRCATLEEILRLARGFTTTSEVETPSVFVDPSPESPTFGPSTTTKKIENKDKISLSAEDSSGIFLDNTASCELLSKKPSLFWAHICVPSANDSIDITQAFKMHPLTVEDICGADASREKLEVFRTYLYFSIDCIDPSSDTPTRVHIVIFENCVLSFSRIYLQPIQNALDRVSTEISSRSKRGEEWTSLLAGDWILYFLIDGIIDDFIPEIKALHSEAETIDDLVYLMSPTERADLLRRIGTTLQRLRKLQPTFIVKEDILKKLCISQNVSTYESLDKFVTADPKRYLMDVLDHIVEARHSLHFIEHLLETSAQNYLAQVSVEMTEASNRMAYQMARLSIVATFMLPLNLIAGLFGMNCNIPGRDEDNLNTFFIIIGSMGLYMLFMVWLMRDTLLI
eukprot:c20654_g1_i3.p1 GENE.c20654_g1_i3~~c20654_g1_i3.p1  ORF type:complete len:403 (+),score=149.07 c20654_g1_i3:246-1454(+)